jgi:regulatory protein
MQMQDEITLLSLEVGERNSIITLSNGDVLELATESLPPDQMTVGEKLSSELLDKLNSAFQKKEIARKVFDILDRHLQSISRIQKKLVDKGYNQELVVQVLAKFQESGLISDTIFAEAYCRDILLSKLVGKMYFVSKLNQFGVRRDIINKVISEQLPAELETELCEKASIKWWQKKARGDYYKDEQRCRRFLAGRGFNMSIISLAMNRIKESS